MHICTFSVGPIGKVLFPELVHFPEVEVMNLNSLLPFEGNKIMKPTRINQNNFNEYARTLSSADPKTFAKVKGKSRQGGTGSECFLFNPLVALAVFPCSL